MQHYVVVHKASCEIYAALCVVRGVSKLTQHFVAELCRRKAERLTHLIMYTCPYNIM
jgi:hypothetical protein